MSEQRVSPGQQWVMRAHGPNHLPTRMGEFRDEYLTVNEVHENLDGGRTDYATMKRADGQHAFTIELPVLRMYFLLTKDVPADTPRNPAERHAAEQGLPVVVLTTHDAVMIASGRSIMTRTTDGGEVLVRLFRPEEFKETLLRVAASTETGMPIPDDARIEDLVRPLRLP